jgi:hypothetical protein
MINYLAQPWDLINSIHQQFKRLIIYNQTLAKADFYVGRCLKGLQRVSQKLSLWIRYSVADDKSFVRVTDILKAVNVLRNQLEVNVLNPFKPTRLKNSLTDIYQQLVSILPCDVQLSLFGYGDEVGWCAEVPANTSPYLSNITEWLKARLSNGQRTTCLAVACFNHVCGIQLTMPWETEALIGRAVA